MDLRVTVGAAPVEHKHRGWILWIAGMTDVQMTLLAEPRLPDLEEKVVYCPVGLVAIAAVFQHRRMLP